MILAEKISTLRREHNLSQEQLAEKLDVSRQSVSKWENGTATPDLTRIVQLSELFGVSTDYLLHDEFEPTETESYHIREKSVSLEQAIEFLDLTERTASRIAFGVALCILAPAVLIALMALSQTAVPILSEEAAGGIGVCILLVMIAAGVFLLISTGMRLDRFRYLEEESITLEYGVAGQVNKRKEDFSNTHLRCVTFGVVLCILSVVPVVAAGAFDASDFILLLTVSLLLILIAAAVWLFCYSGSIQESYEKLLQEGDYTVENKQITKKTGWFAGAYWCALTALYLLISFLTDRWDRTWICFAVGGVLYAALSHIIRRLASNSK